MSNPIDTWKGVRIDKMLRRDLESEFVKLAQADAERNERYVPTPREVITLDPQTARCMASLREIIDDIEGGKVVLRLFGDTLTENGALNREVAMRVTFNPPRAKP